MLNMHDRETKSVVVTADANTVANGIKFEIMPVRPIQVVRWGGVVTTTITTNPLLARMNFRPVAGSAAGEVQGATASGVDTAGGSISLSTALGVAGRAFMHTIKPNPSAQTVSAPLSVGLAGIIVLPGQSCTLEAFGTAPAAGVIAYFAEFINLPTPKSDATGLVVGPGAGTLIEI